MRLLLALIALGSTFAVAWIAVNFPPGPIPTRFALAECRRVALDAPSGPIVGAEDLALAPDGRRLVVSAYDRAAVEAAWAAGDPAPDGGLYAVALADLAGPRAPARPLADPSAFDGGLRPHGIDVAADGRVAFVNRLGPAWSVIEVARPRDGSLRPLARIERSALCRANDVAFGGAGVAATVDRGACGFAFSDYAPGARTGMVMEFALDGTEAGRIGGLAFANGIAAGAVAETRASAIRLADGRRIETPGGPDNLTLAPDGALVAAVHPSLIQLALHRNGLRRTAPSRIVRVDPATGAVAGLVDDPAGALFSAATVGLLVGDGLVAGAVLDAGLLVCGEVG